MALKTKGDIGTRKAATPKAGPKKRRAKLTEQEMIRAAVDEHGRRGAVRARRKSGKVASYTYKDVERDREKRRRADSFLAEMDRVYALRTPHQKMAFLAFFDGLKEDEQPFATKLFQMACEHEDSVLAESSSYVSGIQPEMVVCKHCGLARKWWSNKTETKRQEFVGYCPDGYDMFDWLDLYTKDRSMWRFLHDECLAEMVDESMTTEEVAA